MTRQLFLITALFLFVFDLCAQQNGNTKTVINAYQSMTDASQIFEEQELRKKMKEDGLTEPVINKLIEERKKLHAEGKKLQWKNYEKSSMNPVPMATCGDMGVENGWSQWTGVFGTNSGSNPPIWGTPTNPPPPTTSNSNISITSGPGIDPCTPGALAGSPPIPVVCPGSGSKSIQMGQQQTASAYAERATFPFTVTPFDTNFIYSYALVFYDPSSGHAPNERPFAEIMILDMNGDTILCSYNHFSYSSGDPSYFFANATCVGGSSSFYKPWTSAGVNLAQYIGQTVTIVITNGDCVHGGHFGHSYWDFSCGPNIREFCSGSSVTICAPIDTSASQQYQWYLNAMPLANDTFNCVSISPNNSDTLFLQVMPPSGCGYWIQYIMQDSCLTSVQENNSLQGVAVYPTPASQNIFLDFNGAGSGNAEVLFLNVLGEQVYRISIPASGKHMLDVSGFSEGIYFTRIETAVGNMTKKFIISR